jgi:hypothetical protein
MPLQLLFVLVSLAATSSLFRRRHPKLF